MSALSLLAAIAIQTVVTNGVEVSWFEDMVPMKDGVCLYTYGVVPQHGAMCPIVIGRNPYVKESRINGPAYAHAHRGSLRRGYAFVGQHVRGAGMSEGKRVPGTKRRVSFRFADHAFRLEKGDVLRADVASASSQFAPHANVKGEQFRIAKPRVAHNRVYAAESELVLHVLAADEAKG